jgi:hypothetical protein
VELVPPPARETPVATAGPSAADLLLEHHDAQPRVALMQEISRPEAAESPADDHDVGLDVPGEGRARHPWILRERVAEPPAALPARRERKAGQVEVVGASRHGASLAP